MFDFNHLFAEFHSLYYTIVIMGIVELVAIIFALRYKQNDRIWLAFTIYLSLDFLILIIGIFLKALSSCTPSTRTFYFNNSNIIIALTELLCYYYYFYKILSGSTPLRSIKILGLVYTTLVLLYITGIFNIFFQRFTYLTYLLGALEFILILPFCLVYFKEVTNTSSGEKILARPSFWIVTGIFFFCIFSVPSYLLYDYIKTRFHNAMPLFLAIFYYIPFTINFIFLAKAFSLKKDLTV